MYFLAKYKDSSPSITRPDEVKALKILKLEDAINTIEYDNKKEMLKKADSYLKSKAENTFFNSRDCILTAGNKIKTFLQVHHNPYP